MRRLALVFCISFAAQAQEPLRLAVPDPLGLERAKQDAAAIAELLGKQLGRQVVGQAVRAAEIPALVASGKVDLGWLSAAEYIDAAKAAKVLPVARLVRNGLPFYRSVIFARADKAPAQLADLKGKRVALVAKGSAAGHLLARSLLRGAGVEVPEDKLHADHAEVCKAVLDGQADAGATFGNDKQGKTGIEGCAQSSGERVKELKVVASSHPIPNDVMVARAGYPEKDQTALRQALVGLRRTPEGQAALKGLFHAEGFIPCEDDDFSLLRETLAGAPPTPR